MKFHLIHQKHMSGKMKVTENGYRSMSKKMHYFIVYVLFIEIIQEYLYMVLLMGNMYMNVFMNILKLTDAVLMPML